MITLSGGETSLKTALQAYKSAWKAFIVINHLEALEYTLEPAAISWKVEHKVALLTNLRLLADKASQVHIGTVNDRFIATAVLREPYENFPYVKILERRRAVHDPLGLDSLDYRVQDLERTFGVLRKARARITKESNSAHTWLSLRFGNNDQFEAKFIDHSLLDIAINELTDARNMAP